LGPEHYIQVEASPKKKEESFVGLVVFVMFTLEITLDDLKTSLAERTRTSI